MRIAFFGTPAAAVPALEAFLADPDIEVTAVITNPDRPSGRGHKLAPPPVKVSAEDAGVPVWQPQKPRECVDDLVALNADACAVVAYGSLLPADVLAAGGKGFVNLHFSLLPSWRGAAPVQHSILSGEPLTGVTCFVLDEGMDTGPVLSAWRTPIQPAESAGELTARLAGHGAIELVQAVKGWVQGRIEPVPQDHALATYAPKITAAHAEIDWGRPAERIALAIRAFNPVPGAHTTYRAERLKVHRAEVVPEPGTPGVVGRVVPRGPIVGCGPASLLLTEVQPAGKARMDGAAFSRGYRPEGARLGPDRGEPPS